MVSQDLNRLRRAMQAVSNDVDISPSKIAHIIGLLRFIPVMTRPTSHIFLDSWP